MNIIGLTNLGHLTLRNLMHLERRYEGRLHTKKKKLSKLWNSVDSMDNFVSYFSSYQDQGGSRMHFAKKEGKICMIYPEILSSEIDVDKEVKRFLDEYYSYGLIQDIEVKNNLEDTLEGINISSKDNPLTDFRHINVEFTGLCNLYCKHCYRGGSKPEEYGLSVAQLKDAFIPILRSGINRFTFTGGEPTVRKNDLLSIIGFLDGYLDTKKYTKEESFLELFGVDNITVEELLKTEKWVRIKENYMSQLSRNYEDVLIGEQFYNKHNERDVGDYLLIITKKKIELVSKEKKYGQDHVAILTNGFIDGQEEFVNNLKQYETQLQVSLDSYNGHRTNKNRGKRGVFGKVKNLVKLARKNDLRIIVASHNIGGARSRRELENKSFFDSYYDSSKGKMYQFGNALNDDFETLNQGVRLSFGELYPGMYHDGWCTAWEKPRDIHIKPTGVVGNCRFAHELPEEFGNIKESSMMDILNNIQDTRVYEMFKDGSIEKYQHEIYTDLFDKYFGTKCGAVVVTLTYGLIKEQMERDGVKNPQREANLEVARRYGYLKN